jgi:ATP-binding cassette subfamily B protein
MIFIILPRCIISGNRILEVLDSKTRIKNGTVKQEDKDKIGQVVFDNVSFKYPDAQNDILQNISFTANKGETIAILGKTGSGKSTIIDLIERFHDITGGKILISGQDIKDYDTKYLHKKIGLVSQKASLFNRTIKENVAYSEEDIDNIDLDRVKQSLEDSKSLTFVNDLVDKENTIVSQGGTNLSGGQKQRLSIARALYAKPEILIFDDSFSALDYKTDTELRKTIKQKYSNLTTIIIGQRIGTIKNADKILVLEDGKIVGMGKHDELYKTCKLYKDIALTQLSEEEAQLTEGVK